MNVNLTPTLIKDSNREAEAIALLHQHKGVILEALDHSVNPLSNFTANEIKDFLK